MYSYGPPHMAVQKQDDQHEHTFSNYVRIRDVVQKTCLRRWTIGKSGERGLGISVLPARHDDDDNMYKPDLTLSNLQWLICQKTIIIIIIMSCRKHAYPWPSLASSPYYSSSLAGLQGYIPNPHIAAVCMFEMVVLLFLGHMRGPIGVHHLWARPCFSSSVLHVWFV